MAVNLFALAQQPERATYKSLADTADEAARHAEALDSLIDNQADDPAGLLVPVRDFLRVIAGTQMEPSLHRGLGQRHRG